MTEAVDIAVIDLPHISNFTDLDALRVEPDVRVRIIRSADRLGAPDAVILPGSKNVIGDLAYLRTSGLADRIAALAGDDACEIVGLCGGFQMLGRSILDPERIESDAGRADALALLNVSTVLAAEKTLVRVEAVHAPSNCPVVGYEIHHGQTNADGAAPLFTRPTPRLAAIPKGCALGAAREDHRVWGTYLHGVFDADEFRRWFVDRLRVRRGLPPVGRVAARYDIEPALDRLADAVRASLDMDRIYRLMGLR